MPSALCGGNLIVEEGLWKRLAFVQDAFPCAGGTKHFLLRVLYHRSMRGSYSEIPLVEQIERKISLCSTM